MAPDLDSRPRLRIALTLVVTLLLARSGLAETIQTAGIGSAVKAIGHVATFDALATGSLLGGYTEDGLVIDVPDTCFCTGYHFPNGGSTAPTTISAAEGEKLVALEFEAWRSSEIPGQSIYYWEAHDDGAVVGSGVVIQPYGRFLGFYDPAGFDELQIMAHFRERNVREVAETGFANASTLDNSISIDNVFAEIAVDLDEDARVGRFDNCAEVPNPDQADRDGDGIGDACDEFPDGGSALSVCLEDLDAALHDPRLRDSDGDGESDPTDLCPETAGNAEVDEAGCSGPQFCSSIDASTLWGTAECILADWRNDEWYFRLTRDCRVVGRTCRAL